jgi:hypothetical protein
VLPYHCSLLRHIKSEKLYKWPTLPFVTLNITTSLIDFMIFRREYQRRNSKRNARFCVSSSISCTQLVLVCRLLWWTSLWHSQHNDLCLISAIRNVDYTGKCCGENLMFYFLYAALLLYNTIRPHLVWRQKYRPLNRLCVDKYASLSLLIVTIWGQDRQSIMT